MLQLTPKATRHLIQVRRERGVDKKADARFVRRNGRVGLTFTTERTKTDRVVEAEEIQVYIATEIADTLDQAIIDARAEEGKTMLVIRRQAAGKTAAAKAATTKASAKGAAATGK
jgi:Fe-S cluster assembly iron-binding protein IscA